MAKIICPECEAVLKPSKPVPAGKKVSCPKCGAVFLAPDEEDEPRVTARKPSSARQMVEVVEVIDDEDEAPRPSARKAKPVAKKTAPAKPTPKAPSLKDDDEEVGGMYGVIKDPDEENEEKKPKIEYAPDLTVKDPRGPATQALALPSNGLLVLGFIGFIGGFIYMCVIWWPVFFTQYGTMLEPARFKTPDANQTQRKPADDDDRPLVELKLDDLNATEKAAFETAKAAEWVIRTWVSVGLAFGFLLTGCMMFGAVKMVNLESYGWAMAACIIAIASLGIFHILFGVLGLIQLKKPEIKAAFEWKSEYGDS